MRATVCNCIMTLARIVGTVRRDRADVLAAGDLVLQYRQHWRIADMAPRDLDRPNLQRVLVDSEVNLAPQAPLWPAVLAHVPFAFPLHLDPGAVDQLVQRPQ